MQQNPTPQAQAPTRTQNTLVAVFASVQLALILLGLLAATAVIGTVVPQNAAPEFYARRYGPGLARFFELLDIGDMYNSWWFLGLLALFAVNLIVCSLERLPRVIRLLRRDHLNSGPEQLARLGLHRRLDCALPPEEAAARLRAFLRDEGWPARERAREGAVAFHAPKAAWSRFGVYVVHLSILVILAGAVLGSPAFGRRALGRDDFAFKGFIMLPVGASADQVEPLRGRTRAPLGFTLRCDDFGIDFYDNGMPKSYRSRVSILENGREVRQAAIEVNRPLRHRGVTFYQASYQPYPEYRIELRKLPDGLESAVTIPPAREARWPEAGVSYGIINREQLGEVTARIKLWFSDGEGEPAQLWLDMGREAVIDRPSGQYRVRAVQTYATGLQAAKDPGVPLVYGGCLLMLIGLYVAFFLSHRQILAVVTAGGAGSRVDFAGTANKNTLRFAALFAGLAERLAERLSPTLSKD